MTVDLSLPPALFDVDELVHAAAAETFEATHHRPGFTPEPTLTIFEPKTRDVDAPWWWYRHGWSSTPGYDVIWDQPGHLARHASCDLRCDPDTTPTTLTSGRRHWQGRCSCPGAYLHVIICTCGHTTRPQRDENTAAEVFADHHTPGWRNLPPIPLDIVKTGERSKAEERRYRAWIDTHYGDQPPGTPIRTDRTYMGGRHVPRHSPWDGYNFAATIHPASPTRHSHDRGITWHPGTRCDECEATA